MNIEHPNYTLVAYKADGCTMCRGHVMDRFSSDFQLHTALMMDECLTKHAELTRLRYEDQEPQFDVTILYRGVPIAECGQPIYDLYTAALEAEVEDQNREAEKLAVIALQERQVADAQKAESQRLLNVQRLTENAEKLGFNIIPK